MEHILRCNTLKCRRELNDRALVTTCSHCFCIECANQFQLLSRQDGQYPVCPACHINLTNPDDAVVATLNPTEDYKTSVLSGLSPNIIVECAGRALSFWAYQTTQEMYGHDLKPLYKTNKNSVYQEYCVKNLTNKYAVLNTRMDKVIHDANAEISNMHNKILNMQSEQDILRQKNRDLAQQLRDRTRKHHETQELYDKLKRRNLLEHVQDAASDAVEETIQNSVAANRYMDKKNVQDSGIPPPPLFSYHQTSNLSNLGNNLAGGLRGPHILRNNDGKTGSFPRPGIAQPNQMQTPSTHRTSYLYGKSQPYVEFMNRQDRNSMQPQQRISPRETLSTSNNNYSGIAGYGMSAGLKVSNAATMGPNGLLRPITHSRADQKQTSNHQQAEDKNVNLSVQSNHNLFINSNNNH